MNVSVAFPRISPLFSKVIFIFLDRIEHKLQLTNYCNIVIKEGQAKHHRYLGFYLGFFARGEMFRVAEDSTSFLRGSGCMPLGKILRLLGAELRSREGEGGGGGGGWGILRFKTEY